MKPSPFRYHAPESLDAAVGVLAGLDNAKVLAGGQSLMAMLNLRYAMPDDLVDLNRIDGLAGVAEAGDRLRIGAMTRQRALERDPLLFARAPVFREALLQVGHIQTRNRGTIGGSLCHLDPAAELPALCMLYDAGLTARGPGGERRIAMADFPSFYMTPALEPDEILTGIEIAPRAAGSGHAFVEFARRHGDFAIVAVGCLLEPAADGTIARAAVVLGGVGAAPLRLTAAEAALAGQRPDADALAAAAAGAEGIEAMDDDTYSSDYRRHLARVLTGRALARAAERMQGHAA
jgi:carbon-monoxide dehydrogenase medium subunit